MSGNKSSVLCEIDDAELEAVAGGGSEDSSTPPSSSSSMADLLVASAQVSIAGTMASSAAGSVRGAGDAAKESARGG